MNASSFITFFIYMLRQNVILIWKELSVALFVMFIVILILSHSVSWDRCGT